MFWLIVVAALTVFISCICSLFEATLYSTRLSTLEAAKAEGRHSRDRLRRSGRLPRPGRLSDRSGQPGVGARAL